MSINRLEKTTRYEMLHRLIKNSKTPKYKPKRNRNESRRQNSV